MDSGRDNPTYIADSHEHINSTYGKDPKFTASITHNKQSFTINDITATSQSPHYEEKVGGPQQRDQWGKSIEFLMSCIAMSVGLGNVWRFPFTALENGGGAFLIPYIIVLILVGRPIYYMEMIIGQFSSKGSVKCFDFAPAMRGVGYGQILAIAFVTTYYASLMALSIRYLVASFTAILPWSTCQPEWDSCIPSDKNAVRNITTFTNESRIGYGEVVALGSLATYYGSLLSLILYFLINSFRAILPWSECQPEWRETCMDAAGNIFKNGTLWKNGSKALHEIDENKIVTSSELYFIRDVLNEKDNIDDGIGVPDWRLTLCLAFSWLLVTLTLVKGVRSAGKVSYFLALFPYVVMIILLIRAVTLEGAMNGIIYFIKPQWDKILEPKVWYAAVTQVFFSLSVCFGNVIMYSSYNRFSHNVYRDANIVTSIDTFTSLLAGCIIFGILGHLAHETGVEDIGKVIKGGSGLAFISYPDAIAKFDFVPQLFSVLFFLMLYVLGIGSNVAMTSCIMTIVRDAFPKVKHWHAVITIAVLGLATGSVYVTPGGQYILNLVDHFGGSFIAFVLAVAELIAVGWIYGVDRLCKDIEFMLNRKTGLYWRICWGFVTPLFMMIILLYSLISMKPLTYKDLPYPDELYVVGWCIAAFGLLQLPIWMFYAIVVDRSGKMKEKILNAFRPLKDWGPVDPEIHDKYLKFIDNEMSTADLPLLKRIKINLLGGK